MGLSWSWPSSLDLLNFEVRECREKPSRIRPSSQRIWTSGNPEIWNPNKSRNKCHVCLGSYNETAQHAKRQHNGAEESSRQQRRGARQGRSRAGQQSKAARQRGRRAVLGSRARQGNRAAGQGKAVGQGSKRNSTCKRLQRCEHLSTNMLSLSRVFTHWHKPICKRLQRCGHLSKIC